MHRRTFVVAAGVAAIPFVATVSTAAPDDVVLLPEDIVRTDSEQRLTLAVTGVEHDRLTVAIDFEPLVAAGIDIDDLSVDEDRMMFDGADIVGVDLDGSTLRLDLEVDDEAFRGRLVLIGLGTDNLEHAPERTYAFGVDVGDADPQHDRESDAFDLVDPDTLPPELAIDPGWIEIGEREQPLDVRVEYPPVDGAELRADINVSELEAAGIEMGELTVAIAEGSGVADAEAELLTRSDAHLVRIRCLPEDLERAVLGLVLEIGETDDAEPRELAYYARLEFDGEPALPTSVSYDARSTFSLHDAPDHPPDRPDSPQPEPTSVDETTDGDRASDELPGLGILATVVGIGGAIAARARWTE